MIFVLLFQKKKISTFLLFGFGAGIKIGGREFCGLDFGFAFFFGLEFFFAL